MFRTYAICLGLLASCSGDNLIVDAPDSAPIVDIDASVDASVDAEIDAETIPRPPLPMPSPCDTCVGFSCDSVCVDAGVDAP